MNHRWLYACIGAMAAFMFAAPVNAQMETRPDLLSVAVGIFDVGDDYEALEGRVEYRPGVRAFDLAPYFYGVGPVAGLLANVDGTVYGYGGFFLDFRLADRVLLWPTAAVGAYHDGGSRDLGGVIEFQTGLTVAYQFENDSHVGVTFSHISNASIYDRNPGSYVRKLVTELSGGVFGYLDSVLERHSFDEFGELI